ncbi:lipopolysaccharide assembly protein LapA domain-containing protein [Thermus sediminis]|uniref:lipopolysaccharide assembly protein LapA domain-containing protein n=1 Tax=Thermus sediminis TaxID=1761908 RepID=UPI000E3E81EE|nr:lipopolysaccharide assembly protein LapA domain-containing protein [Thermus sediminis]
MKLLQWVFLLASLGAAGAGVYLYYAYPFLEVPSPSGPLPLYYLLPGAYLLGLLVGGLFALAFWLRGVGERGRLLREIRRLQGEVDALKRERIEEIPRIPDRDEA